MSDKIIIVDFEDSFTFNIANILFAFEKKILVISHVEFFKSYLKNLKLENRRIAIILGPGPGHPDEYQKYYEDIKKIVLNKNIYCMGICLGHQIMARVEGCEVSLSAKQMHGQTIEVDFRGSKKIVQRYNSLSVLDRGLELNIIEYQNGISYQFHPESVGTLQNDIFFENLLSFIKYE